MRLARTILLLTFATVASAQTPLKPVVFVCEHGAAKSVVAAAHFNKLAAERGLPVRAISRGTAPDAAVPAGIADGLRRDGLAVPAGFVPTLVSSQEVANATRVVAFDVTLPGATASRWDKLPAFSDGYDAASRAIADRVEALVRELESISKKKN
jgi:arsenate reductase (thioredoxin)